MTEKEASIQDGSGTAGTTSTRRNVDEKRPAQGGAAKVEPEGGDAVLRRSLERWDNEGGSPSKAGTGNGVEDE